MTGVAAAKDALYVRRMNGGVSDFLKVGYAAGAKPSMIKLPFAGDIDELAVDPRLPGAIFNLGGWTRFGGYYAYDPKARKSGRHETAAAGQVRQSARTSLRPKSR